MPPRRHPSRPPPAVQHCFHCDLPVPQDGAWRLEVLDGERSFCCLGCLEVCRAIVGAGLQDYYRHRTGPAAHADPEGAPDFLRKLTLYDHPAIQKSFVRDTGALLEASLILENIRCAACVWLNEQHLRKLDGVVDVQMDYASQRAQVWWDPHRIKLSDILRAVHDIGYVAHPYDPTHRDELLKDRKRRDAGRLLFAGILGMPVMQFSLATYAMGETATGQLEVWERVGRWSTLLAVTAMLLYSAQDFFVGAWRDVRSRRLGMDVPIILGLSTAWLGSLLATVRQQGDVYVDSIAMFVFFVLLARILEMQGRLAAANAMDRLARVVPQTARRIRAHGEEEVPAVELEPGDRLRIVPGASIPADGVILEGHSSFDESVLTGEVMPVAKGPGEQVVAGTCNRETPVVIEVTRVGQRSTVGEIRHLLDRGLRSRPRYAVLAERAAEGFVAGVLLIAALTAGVWLWIEPAAAVSNTVSVLIVTCPCALALATPVAIAVSTGRFAEMGILPLRMSALEALSEVDMIAFDKTGTLTLGALELVAVHLTGALDRDSVLAYASALEQESEHPVGQALKSLAPNLGIEVRERRNVPGAGVSGLMDRTVWRLGKPQFALQDAEMAGSIRCLIEQLQGHGLLTVILSARGKAQAVLGLRDVKRPGAEALVSQLAKTGSMQFALLSGDSPRNVTTLAAELGISQALGEMSPEDKLNWIKDRQRAGCRVLMVGDGINDAPTLAVADVSMSFAEATELAQYHSDFIVLASDIRVIASVRQLARRTRRIIRQNLAWAAAYNLLTVPAAAMGLVPPWAAAIGMSVSSLVVVGNALRLRGDARLSRWPLFSRIEE